MRSVLNEKLYFALKDGTAIVAVYACEKSGGYNYYNKSLFKTLFASDVPS